jgi:hypothetical protein
VADLPIILRPIVSWPGELSRQYEAARFSSTFTKTRSLLVAEARHLGAREVIVQLGISEEDLRIDGELRAHAEVRHPGVIVSMETTKLGSISVITDRFGDSDYWTGKTYKRVPGWHNNLRAIALGLEALRKVERYGIIHDDEQYTGFRALGSGIPMPAAQMTVDEAARLLSDAAGQSEHASEAIGDRRLIKDRYREAAKLYHPDAGGDPDAFKRLTEARDLLLAHA